MICCTGWAIGTMTFAMTSAFWQMIVVCFATDFFVSAVKPLLQSWILCNVPREDQGKAMSQMNLFGLVGWTVLAGLAASLSNASVGFLSGWRVLFLVWMAIDMKAPKKSGSPSTFKDLLLLAVRFPS